MAASQTSSRIGRVRSPEVPEPAPGTWSNCLVVDGIAYVAGLIARGKDGKILAGDEYEQAREIFAKIRHLLEAAGGSMADVVKVVIFVTDISPARKGVARAPRGLQRGLSRQYAGTGRSLGGAGRQGGDRSGCSPWCRRALSQPYVSGCMTCFLKAGRCCRRAW